MHSHSILVLFVTYLVERQRPPLALAAALQSFKLRVVSAQVGHQVPWFLMLLTAAIHRWPSLHSHSILVLLVT